MKTLQELNKQYDLELDKIVNEIKKNKAKLVLLQFPDGLKPYATAVVDYLEKKTDSEFLIWMETCYGACDLPVGLKEIKPQIDMTIQFGHNSMMPDY